jgi:hypothetical protein
MFGVQLAECLLPIDGICADAVGVILSPYVELLGCRRRSHILQRGLVISAQVLVLVRSCSLNAGIGMGDVVDRLAVLVVFNNRIADVARPRDVRIVALLAYPILLPNRCRRELAAA